ncbi:hypothetical protein F5X99DRAFT_207159 [Biscogniauxia marginata]|nr:hypothetical protein F5X99DRAFT_207159 [Biscogniauxia marginata]
MPSQSLVGIFFVSLGSSWQVAKSFEALRRSSTATSHPTTHHHHCFPSYRCSPLGIRVRVLAQNSSLLFVPALLVAPRSVQSQTNPPLENGRVVE